MVLMERVSQCWHRFNEGMGVVRRGWWWWWCLELRRSAQVLIEMKSAGSELFSLWPFFFPSTPSPFSAA